MNSALSAPFGARRCRRTAVALALVGAAALWWLVASLLWRSTVPGSLHLARVDPARFFTRSFLNRSFTYERFLDIDALLGEIAVVAVLVVYAWRGQRFTRDSAAGPIGTGMLLGMLGFALVWLTQLPFGLAAVWWERRHHVSHQGYVSSVLEGFTQLGGKFLFVCVALAIAMSLASVTRRWWWALAAPVFVGLALLFTFLSIYLIPGTHTPSTAYVRGDEPALARIEGVPHTKVVVQNVDRFTTAPNAESVGFGPTRRVILWNTLLDGRFDRREVDVVMAHELGHLAHHHPLERVGWLALLLIPLAGLIAWVTSRRGGMARAEAVPLALLVFVTVGLLVTPLQNMVYRREEAEADWSALRATHDPQAARDLFVNLARTSMADPDPPSWSYVLDDDHPTIVQRIAMVQAFQAR